MTQTTGRAGRNGFLATELIYSKSRDTASSSTRPVPPDDILFSRKGARKRSAEEGDYVGIDKLGPIPPSDLLETTHRYVSRFYDWSGFERKHLHYKSMDGTALLALGILLEEALEESLGETGHLAFLNAGEEEENTTSTLGWDGHAWVKKVPRRSDVEIQSVRSAHIAGSLNQDELGEDEASDIVQNEDDDEVQEDWQSPSPSRVVRTIEPRTEGPEHLHERSPTNSRTVTLALPSSSNHENIDISAIETLSARKIGARRSKRIHDDDGYKSTAMVHSSDEDESSDHEDISATEEGSTRHPDGRRSKRIYGDEGYKSTAMVHSDDEDDTEAPSSEHDVEMVDIDDSAVRRICTSPQPSTDHDMSSDSDVESGMMPARAMLGRRNDPSQPANETSKRRSLSQASEHSRESLRTQSEASDDDSLKSSESEDEDAAAKAIAPTHRDVSHHEPKKNTTVKETSKVSVNRPEDKMAMFKKSMDDLLERLMSQ